MSTSKEVERLRRLCVRWHKGFYYLMSEWEKGKRPESDLSLKKSINLFENLEEKINKISEDLKRSMPPEEVFNIFEEAKEEIRREKDENKDSRYVGKKELTSSHE